MGKRTIIIGGVAGGATTAARLRRRTEAEEIILLERGEYISYANCGLPYYIGGTIANREALLLQTPEAMRKKYQIDVRIFSEAIAIKPEQKAVVIKNIKTGEVYQENYDSLVLATGSNPLIPPIPGIDGPNIYTLWTVPDTDAIKAVIQNKRPKHAAVIGGGFIGLEMAENLSEAGISVSIIEMQNQVMAPFDYEMAQLLHENLEQNGVELILQDGVSRFSQAGTNTEISLTSGKTVIVDLVILAIGVRPNSSLAKKAGIATNEKDGIVVNEKMQTNIPDIYAVGDVAVIENHILKIPTMIPLAGPANKQARICADQIAGDEKASYQGTQGTSVAKIFDYTAAAVGVNEKTLLALGKQKNVDYFSVIINQKSHAGYYPGATQLMMKGIFDKEGKLYGAQIVGQDGADKRIDTIATTMRLGGTIYDLRELELAYAPPYSSAKDPVNMLGFVAENILRGFASFLDCIELDKILENTEEKERYVVLDVTEEMERMVYAIPGSVHIPLGELRSRLSELDPEKCIVPYCAVGVRSYNAARILLQSGFQNVRILTGGISFYKSMHYKEFLVKKEEKQKQEKIALQAAAFCTEEKANVRKLDCCGLQCPGPIMKVNEEMKQLQEGELLQVSATDMGFARDIEAWCRKTGNTFMNAERKNHENIVTIKKRSAGKGKVRSIQAGTEKQGKTIVVFSGDLDKAMASFIIANGAAAMGRPVTMFFTFWGLNILRKPKKQKVKKMAMDQMFSIMMPRGSKHLKISKMNMGGMGTSMMKHVMKKKHVEPLESLIKKAKANGVKLVACTMSMDIMGIKKEELIKGVKFGGVASYLGDAEESNVNLFI